MSFQSRLHFPLVDRFIWFWMGLEAEELPPGAVRIVETPHRLYSTSFWAVLLEDGRALARVPPGTGTAVEQFVSGLLPEQWRDPAYLRNQKDRVDAVLGLAGLPSGDRFLVDKAFACNRSLLRRHEHGECRQLVDVSIPFAQELEVPVSLFPDCLVYGVIADGQVVSVAYVDRPHGMENRVDVAYIGVDTAPTYRRRGYAQTAVSAVVEHVTRRGGEAWWDCDPSNAASIATARSVGYVEYGVSVMMTRESRESIKSSDQVRTL